MGINEKSDYWYCANGFTEWMMLVFSCLALIKYIHIHEISFGKKSCHEEMKREILH